MDRSVRMLDAAGELLLAHGYRRVTIDDVARRAGVGKGTVYLHWASKLELFAAVLLRDSVRITRGMRAALHADPAEVLLHRSLRRSLLLVAERPLTWAMHNGDTEILGEIVEATRTGSVLTGDSAEFGTAQYALLHRHGLLADDPATTPDLAYRLHATVVGFFLDRPGPPGPGDTTARADALAVVVKRAFEPPGEPDPAVLPEAAAELDGLYDHILTRLAAALPEEP